MANPKEYPVTKAQMWEGVLSLYTNPGDFLKAMQRHDTLPSELKALVGVPQCPVHHPEGCAFSHSRHVLNEMASIVSREAIIGERRLVFMFAALTHDLGKATTTKFNIEKGKWTAYGHDVASVPLARSLMKSVGHEKLFAQVAPLVRHHMAHCRQGFTEKAVRKLARELQPMTIADLCLLMEADCGGRPPIPPGLPKVVTEELVPIACDNEWFHGPHPNDRH